MSALLALLFGVGLIVRLVRWVREGGSRGRHQRSGGSSRQEWAPREFADDVPVHRAARSPRPRRSGAAPRRKGA
jgi:hypothetical protein